MKCRELIAFMEEIAPPSIAQEWDNVGLLCGDGETETDTVVVALDCDLAALHFAKTHGAGMVIAHHPVIFTPLRALSPTHPVYRAASNGIAVYAAHTNLDAAKGGVNDALAAALDLRHIEPAFGGIGRVAYLPQPLSAHAFAEHVGYCLQTAVQWRGGEREISKVALVSGAGGEFAAQCAEDIDAFLTGEMKHHEWLAVRDGMTAVAAGHFATEQVVVLPLCEAIQKRFPMLRVLPFHARAPYETIVKHAIT